MRWLHLVHNYPPEFLGGTERVVQALAVAQVSAGHEVCVAAGSEVVTESGTLGDPEVVDGVSVRRIHRRPDEPYALVVDRPRILDQVMAVVEDFRPDAVHLHHWSTLGLGIAPALRAAGLPVVATLHDVWAVCPRFFRTPPSGVECPGYDDPLARDACAECVGPEAGLDAAAARAELALRDARMAEELDACTAVIAPSKSHAAHLARLRPDLWSQCPPLALAHGLLAEPGPPTPRSTDGVFRILHFGNLGAAKGTGDLVDAVEGLEGEVTLDLWGRILEPEIEAAAQAAPRVTLHGAFDGGEPLAGPADLAVFPSRCEESYGLVVEEAQAHGIPVLVTPVGALPERAGAAGRVVGDDGLAAAIEACRRDLDSLAAEAGGRTVADLVVDLDALIEGGS